MSKQPKQPKQPKDFTEKDREILRSAAILKGAESEQDISLCIDITTPALIAEVERGATNVTRLARCFGLSPQKIKRRLGFMMDQDRKMLLKHKHLAPHTVRLASVRA